MMISTNPNNPNNTNNITLIHPINNNPNNPFNNNILMRMSTDDKIKKLVEEMKSGNYYILLLCFLVVFLLVPLWLSKIRHKWIQFCVDLCFLSLIFSSIYLLTILNVPFGKDNPVSLNVSMYEDLVDEINDQTDDNDNDDDNDDLNNDLNNDLDR